MTDAEANALNKAIATKLGYTVSASSRQDEHRPGVEYDLILPDGTMFDWRAAGYYLRAETLDEAWRRAPDFWHSLDAVADIVLHGEAARALAAADKVLFMTLDRRADNGTYECQIGVEWTEIELAAGDSDTFAEAAALALSNLLDWWERHKGDDFTKYEWGYQIE